MNEFEVTFVLSGGLVMTVAVDHPTLDTEVLRSKAETVIAEEYGFYNWTSLVTNVLVYPIYQEN
jgi:hypothetical protein